MSKHEAVSSPPAAPVRTNDDWVAGLRTNDAAGREVQADLRQYLRQGLGRALGGPGDLDDATLEDVTQDALVRITNKLDTFRGDSRFTTWAMAIAIRVAYTALRRRRWGERSLEELGLNPDGPVASPAGDPARASGREDVLAALRVAIERDLTPRQRAAILGELAGMPSATLVEQLGTNKNAFYKLHHDARLRLRGALEERGFSADDVRKVLDARSKD